MGAVPTRGWCPSVRRPMATGDGLLARLHPPGGRLTLAQAREVAAAAQACGNGQVEVTRRGNLQLRGVREAARPALVARMAALDLLEPDGAGPHRLTIVSPLAGLDPDEAFDGAALAAAVERVGRSVEGLPVKTAVAVDGGGSLPLADVEADLHVEALGEDLAAVGLAGEAGPLWIGTAAVRAVPEIVRGLLQEVAELARRDRTFRRVRNLAPDRQAGLGAVVEGLGPVVAPRRRDPGPPAGILALGLGRYAVLAALPFGRCDAAQLEALAALAGDAGAGELRLSPTRGLLVPDIGEADAPALLAALHRLGLIVEAEDPRLLVSACAGGPACASGLTPAQGDAAHLAAAAGALVAQGATLHVSGCAKGCARSGPATLTLVGQAGGGYGIALGGTARAATRLHLSAAAVAARLARLRDPGDLAAAFGASS